MAIPDFQSIMLPPLKQLGDGEEHTNQETADALAREFGLTDEERSQLLPSGSQTVFTNRVAWAKAHFKRAGLIEPTRRGIYRITDLGRDVLRQNPQRIDLRFLDQFPGYREFRRSTRKAVESEVLPDSEMTPEEHIAFGYQQIRDELADQLLQKVKESPPEFFEQLVINLLVAMGYGGSRQDAGRAVGRAGDGGFDGIIKEDRLGLDVIYVQAKRWEEVVGRPEIQKFVGALQGQHARKGIFITTSDFSKEARDYVASIEHKVILVGGEELAKSMIDNGVGVTEVASYSVKRIDSDYFGLE